MASRKKPRRSSKGSRKRKVSRKTSKVSRKRSRKSSKGSKKRKVSRKSSRKTQRRSYVTRYSPKPCRTIKSRQSCEQALDKSGFRRCSPNIKSGRCQDIPMKFRLRTSAQKTMQPRSPGKLSASRLDFNPFPGRFASNIDIEEID